MRDKFHDARKDYCTCRICTKARREYAEQVAEREAAERALQIMLADAA